MMHKVNNLFHCISNNCLIASPQTINQVPYIPHHISIQLKRHQSLSTLNTGSPFIQDLSTSLWSNKLHHFDHVWLQKQIRTILAIYVSINSHFLASSGPREYTFLVFSGSRIEYDSGSRMSKIVQFLGP